MHVVGLSVNILFFFIGTSVCQDLTLRVYNGTMDNYVVIPIEQSDQVVPYLNRSRPTIFYTFGILGNATAVSVTKVVTTLLGSGLYNVVLLDWSAQAKNLLLLQPVSYSLYNAPSAEVVGCRLGNAVVAIIKAGLEILSIILMGHSMGAQIMGNAGRCAKFGGYTLPRIVGLDPAGPGFTTTVAILPTLDKTCAAFVFIIHSDPDGYGSPKATGHIDYFPNYNSNYTMQPGATQKANNFVINSNTTYSHDMAWKFICASVSFPDLLQGEQAADGNAWLAGQGNPNDISIIGINVTQGNGSYFMSTVEPYPYGLGEDGISPPQ